MIGLNIPNNELKTQVFYSTASGATNQWQTWTKPAGSSFIYFMVIGGGAGGGTGRVGGGNNLSGGGGGGGSSAITYGFFPASLLPDILYIQVGVGGLGSSSTSVLGGSGGLSYVSISPSTSPINVLLASGAAGPTGGGGSPLSSGGAAGNGGTIFSQTVISYLGVIDTYAGQPGVTGGNAAAGNSNTIINIVGGGAGGAGYNTGPIYFNGGNISSTGSVETVIGGVGSSGSGGNGSDGYSPTISYSNMSISYPFISTGGAGGGAGVTYAGNGGDGGYGSGGGGGGAGSNAGVFGRGGNGGNGIVIITSI